MRNRNNGRFFHKNPDFLPLKCWGFFQLLIGFDSEKDSGIVRVSQRFEEEVAILRENQASETSERIDHLSEAQIYCKRASHSSPGWIVPMIAVGAPIFRRFCLDLRIASRAIELRSRERSRCYPLMQRNQGLEEWLPVMWKSCWKKCFNVLNLLIPLRLWILRRISIKKHY